MTRTSVVQTRLCGRPTWPLRPHMHTASGTGTSSANTKVQRPSRCCHPPRHCRTILVSKTARQASTYSSLLPVVQIGASVPLLASVLSEEHALRALVVARVEPRRRAGRRRPPVSGTITRWFTTWLVAVHVGVPRRWRRVIHGRWGRGCAPVVVIARPVIVIVRLWCKRERLKGRSIHWSVRCRLLDTARSWWMWWW